MPVILAGPSDKILQEYPTEQSQDSQNYICPCVKEIISVIKIGRSCILYSVFLTQFKNKSYESYFK